MSPCQSNSRTREMQVNGCESVHPQETADGQARRGCRKALSDAEVSTSDATAGISQRACLSRGRELIGGVPGRLHRISKRRRAHLCWCRACGDVLRAVTDEETQLKVGANVSARGSSQRRRDNCIVRCKARHVVEGPAMDEVGETYARASARQS